MIANLKNQQKEKLAKLRSLLAIAETREFTPEERAEVDQLKADVESLKGRIADLESLGAVEEEAASLDRSMPRVSSPPRNEADETRFVNGAPAVHAKKHRFSITRAIDLLAQGKKLDGFEGEVNKEIANRSGKPTNGLYLPWGPEYRDLTTSTGSGAVSTITDGSVIDYLRKRTVLGRLGVTILDNLAPGKFAMPKQTAIGQAYFVAEDGTPTESNPTIGQVLLDPKTLAARTEYSYLLTKQTSISVDQFVEDDLLKALASKIEDVAIEGGGTNEPTGAFQASGVNSVAIGTNGGALTYNHFVAMEREVMADDADAEGMAYLGTPGVNYHSKITPKVSGQAVMINEGGQINGYDLVVSNHVPSDLTKGTGTNLHGVLFGDFSTIVVGLWGPPEVIVDQYTSAPTITKVHVRQAVDVKLRHGEKLCKIVDAVIA